MRTLLLLFLLMNFFIVNAQKQTDWDINYVATKDTVKVGEMYTAYITVKNKSVKESDISLEANGIKLKKDARGRFVFQVKGETTRPVPYSRQEQQFKVKCSDPNVKAHLFVHSYYVNSKGVTTTEATDEDMPEEEEEPLLYVPEMPDFVASQQYPTFNDYLMGEIKNKQVKASGTVFVEVIIDKVGSVNFLKMIRGDINQENLNKLIIILKSSKWKPGKQNNVPVKIKKVIPIRFE